MSKNEERIYVEAGQPATLIDGDKSIACQTLGEAQMAWDKLPEPRKSAATINSGGRVFTSTQIDRLWIKPKF